MSCSEWKEYKFKDIVKSRNQGVNTTTEKVEYVSNGYKVLRAKNISDYNIDYNDVVFIDEETFNRISSNCKPKTGDILYTNIGSQFGSAAIVNSSDKFITAWNILRIVVNDEIINNKFLIYLLNSSNNKKRIQMLNSSSTMPFVSGKALDNVEFILPTLIEQERIVNILSSLDDKIELNNEMNKTLEEMAQSIFKRWFVDFEFPNEDGKPYKSSGGEMVESELGMIPKGWEVTHIDDISQVTMGVSPSSKTYNEDNIGLPLLNGAADFEGKLIKPSKFTSEPKKICKKDDMVFGVRATIGNIVLADKEYALGRGVAAVEPNNKVFREFIYYSLDNSMENLINNASGSVFLNLKKADITDLKVCYSEEIVEKFNNVAKVLIDKVIENDIESEMLKQNRDILLSKLMNGEIQI